MKSLVYVTGFAGLAALYYWLLPVAVQTRLSADHVRYVFGVNDVAPVVGHSLSSLWTLLLIGLKTLGIAGEQIFATSAALSAWTTLLALVIVARVTPWAFLLVLAFAPALLWTAVIPNGQALSFLFLALMALLSNPGVTFENQRRRWTFGAVVDGLASAANPVAWVLVIARVRKVKEAESAKWLRWILFAVGFSLQFVIGILLDPESFAGLPVFSFLRSLPHEDTLGVARVLLLPAWSGSGGELSIGFYASILFVIAILRGKSWSNPRMETRVAKTVFWAIMIFPFLGPLLWMNAWKMAHPGWNTVLEDFGHNIERSVSSPTVAFVRTSTEEAGVRYVSELLTKTSRVTALRPLNLFDESTYERVKKNNPLFVTDEARQASNSATGVDDPESFFIEHVIAPNAKRGVQFWMDMIPDRSEGLEIQFLGNGYRVRGIDGVTKFITDREGLKASYVRAHLGVAEFQAGPSIESQIFERYANFHLAVARVIEREKRTADWERRARGEYYAALKKVEWLHDPFEKVCAVPAAEEEAKIAAAVKAGEKPPERGEPLDVCQETAWFHSRLKK